MPINFGFRACIRKPPALPHTWLYVAYAGLVCLFALVPFTRLAQAGVTIVGDYNNLDVRATGASGKDLIVHLADDLGVLIRYQGIGDNSIDGWRKGSLIHVLSQFFPQYVIVVRRQDGRILEVTITKSGERQAATPQNPTPEEVRRATEAFIPLGFIVKNRGVR